MKPSTTLCLGGCGRCVDKARMACPECWDIVSPRARQRVVDAWDDGRGKGSPTHLRALVDCVKELKALEGARRVR